MKQSIVPIITARVPAFIQDDYPVFAQFLKDYFEWLDHSPRDELSPPPGDTPNFLAVLSEWARNNDPEGYNVKPSEDNDTYLNAILRDVGFIIQKQIAVPKAMLLHSLREFYLSRGSIQSFQYLFKVLFGDSSIEITYPREKLLVLDQANYGELNYIYVQINQSDLNTPILTNILNNAAQLGGTVHGSISKLNAFIEDATIVHYLQGEVLRLQIAKPNGEFDANDQVTITVGTGSPFSRFILNVVVPQITTPGLLYQDNELVQVIGPVQYLQTGTYHKSAVVAYNGSSYINLTGNNAGNPSTDTTDWLLLGSYDATSTPYYNGTIKIEHVSTGSVEQLQIINDGIGYNVGDEIHARPANIINGRGFSGYVTGVTPEGNITSVEVFDPGYGYDLLPTIYITQIPQPAPKVSVVVSTISPTGTLRTGERARTNIFVDPNARRVLPPFPETEDGLNTRPITKLWEWDGQRASATLKISGYNFGTLHVQTGSVATALLHTGNNTAKILPVTKTIGQIQSLRIEQPYLILGQQIPLFAVYIYSTYGTGEYFTFNTQTRYTIKDWIDEKGFLGVNSTLIDSNKYQQFSYQIETQEDPDTYLNVVDDLLHPVGYMRFTVASRSGVASVHAAASTASVVTQPVVVGMAGDTLGTYDVEIESISEALDIDVVLFDNNTYTLVTENGDPIIYE